MALNGKIRINEISVLPVQNKGRIKNYQERRQRNEAWVGRTSMTNLSSKGVFVSLIGFLIHITDLKGLPAVRRTISFMKTLLKVCFLQMRKLKKRWLSFSQVMHKVPKFTFLQKNLHSSINNKHICLAYKYILTRLTTRHFSILICSALEYNKWMHI